MAVLHTSFSTQSHAPFFFLHREYCGGGGDLFSLLRRKERLTLAESAWCIGQTLSALVHLHSHMIVHRGVTTEHLVVDLRGKVTLVDLGCASFIHQVDPNIVVAGCPHTIAPEVWLTLPYSLNVDCWSLGCVLFELLT